MTLRWTIGLAVILLQQSTAVVEAHGPKTASEKKEERFFDCILALGEADQDKNDQLSRQEYQPFLQYLTTMLFGESVLEEDKLPRELANLFKELILVSGAPSDADAIDTFGARINEINQISQQRLHQLHSMCEMVMKELAMLGPQTEAPVLILGHMDTKEFEDEGVGTDHSAGAGSLQTESSEDTRFKNDQFLLTHDMISVHSSFIIANTHSLDAEDIDLSHDGVLYKAYYEFVDTLLKHICPMGIPCEAYEQEVNGAESKEEIATQIEKETKIIEEEIRGEQPKSGHHTRSLLEVLQDHRMLCTDDYHHRQLCGPLNRRLVEATVISDADLYEYVEQECPAGLRQPHNSVLKCGTVYAHYDVIVSYPPSTETETVQQNYIDVTKSAIVAGLLQLSLDNVERGSSFAILGPGKYRFPHHVDASAETKNNGGRHLRNV